MNRYRQFGPLDDTLEVFGDVQFQRLDMLTDPATLEAGAVQVSENLRFDANGAAVRGGLSRQFLAGTNIGTIHFCAIYKPVGDEDQLAFVTGKALYLFATSTQLLTRYPYPASQVILAGDDVDARQAGIGSGTLPVLYILRGLDQPVLKFDGTAVTVDNNVPPSQFGLFYQNRLAVNDSLQSVKVSHFLDFATFTLLDQFQIEQGGADYLVGLLAYQGDYVLIGSRKKWFLAFFDPGLSSTTPYAGAIPNSSFLRLQTNEAGPLGKEAMLESAGLIWFVSDNGIYAFQPTLNNELVSLGRPLSAEIQPVFERISAQFAGQVCIQRYGYRLYFALPISDAPVAIVSVTVANSVTLGVNLPFDLPVNLAAGGLVTIETADPHEAAVGDVVQVANLTGGGVNGQHTVVAVLDENNYVVSVDAATTVFVGSRATSQKLATRNNTIAVLNLNNRDANHPAGMWESIDTLPSGFYADWLRIADCGPQHRLWVVDAVNGPSLYEEGAADEVGDVIGGVNLPFDLPVDLSPVNFASVPVASRLVSRAYRWEGVLGSAHGAISYPRNVRSSEVRLNVAPGDAGNIITRMRIPTGGAVLSGLVEQAMNFTGTNQPDIAVNKRLFNRALEVELEVQTTAGRPMIRALEVQVRKSGQY